MQYKDRPQARAGWKDPGMQLRKCLLIAISGDHASFFEKQQFKAQIKDKSCLFFLILEI